MPPRGASPAFSLARFPDADTFGRVVLLLVLAVGCFTASLFVGHIPLGAPPAPVHSLTQFELHDDVHAGQFRGTPFDGDNFPNEYANSLAYSILSHGGASQVLTHLDKTKQHLSQLESQNFMNDLRLLQRGLRLVTALRLLQIDNPSGPAKEVINKHFDNILHFQDADTGFKANLNSQPSLSGTWFALSALSELGKLEEFKKNHADSYSKVLAFVTSLKADNGGFKDTADAPATIKASYYATRILQLLNENGPLVKLGNFVASCQLQDGGFQDTVVSSVDEYREATTSSTVSTAHALYIAEYLRSVGEESSRPINVGAATAYLAFVSRGGIVRSASIPEQYANGRSNVPDLESTEALLELTRSYPELASSGLQWQKLLFHTLAGGAFLALALGGFYFYKPQLGDSIPRPVRSILTRVPIFLIVGGVSLYFSALCSSHVYTSTIAFLTYLGLVMYLVVAYYEQQENDPTDHMVLLSAIHSALYLGLMFVLIWLAPVVFSQLTGFYLLAAWNIPLSLLVAYFGAYFYPASRNNPKFLSTHVGAGFLAWAVNATVQYLLLYGRGELTSIVRMSLIHGQFFTLFVTLPYLSLLISVGLSAVGCALFVSSRK